MNWLCPFCRRECTEGFDCECGARAVASTLGWTDKPLMRSFDLDDERLIKRLVCHRLDFHLREMLPNGKLE